MDYTPYIKALLATASAEIGYLEKASNAYLDEPTKNAGSKNYTKYARDLDALKTFYNTPKQGAAWCDVFVDWCFVQTFGVPAAKKALYQPDKSLGAGCKYSAKYYKDNNAWYKTPEIGDQIFFTDGSGNIVHTGIVSNANTSIVATIEGNTSSSSGVIANGGGVFGKTYARNYNRIAGYGRPNWAGVARFSPIHEEEPMSDTEKLIASLTPEQAYEIIKKANDYALTLPLPGWADAELGQAMDDDITDGTRPMALIPRYQAAIMCERAYRKAIEDAMELLKGEI